MTDTHREVSGWGLTPRALTNWAPASGESAITRVLEEHRQSARGLIARGLGRSYGDAAQRTGGTTLAIQPHGEPAWLDLESGLVRVSAGVSIGELIQFADPEGFFVPVTPGTRHVSIGGAIAADIHGKDHHITGSFGMHVESFQMIKPDGELISVSRDTDADLFSATIGGMGLTGVVVDADLRMSAVPGNQVLVDTFRTADFDATMDAMREAASTHRYSVSWVDLMASGSSFGRGVVTNGDHTDSHRGEPLRDPILGVPSFWRVGVVNGTSVRAFNEMWFRKAPSQLQQAPQTYDQFFYPLDAIENWNRAYGSRGFLQYQFVIPDEAASQLGELGRALASSPSPVALAVLKILGSASGGYLSFPTPGWTLTADLPIPKSPSDLETVLREVDEAVAAAGGRVYLAKDARMRGDMVAEMYPDLGRFRAVRQRVDPDGVLQSDLSVRLGL